MEIKDLAPKEVWEQFAEICKIPHPSFHEEKVIEYIKNFAISHNLEWQKDKVGNIVVRKRASKGKEGIPGIILQAHTDMVPQKNSDKNFDFLKDSIEPYIDGEWVKAKGTTLGSDDGMGVASMLAILADKTLEHPRLECLFTITEEDGMVGSNGIGEDMLREKILINLDSEQEGEIYVGCAGASNNNVILKIKEIDVPKGYSTFDIELKGLKGGHSGLQIILQRANANKLATRFIREQYAKNNIGLVSFSGGNLRNAIPREAFLTVIVPDKNKESFLSDVEEFEKTINYENAVKEDNLTFKAYKAKTAAKKVIDNTDTEKIINGLTAMPNGVFRMSDSVPGLVETSTNLSIVTVKDGELNVKCMTRCMVNYGRKEVNAMIRAAWANTGATVFEDGEYDGWAPNMQSKLLANMKNAYETLFGKAPVIAAMHAGLEAGILGAKFKGMDMISVGPTLQYPHSPDERVNIESVGKFYKFLVYTLKNFK